MNHFAKIAEKLNTYGLDGMLLTCEANRFYASGFHSTGTDGVALVTREASPRFQRGYPRRKRQPWRYGGIVFRWLSGSCSCAEPFLWIFRWRGR